MIRTSLWKEKFNKPRSCIAIHLLRHACSHLVPPIVVLAPTGKPPQHQSSMHCCIVPCGMKRWDILKMPHPMEWCKYINIRSKSILQEFLPTGLDCLETDYLGSWIHPVIQSYLCLKLIFSFNKFWIPKSEHCLFHHSKCRIEHRWRRTLTTGYSRSQSVYKHTWTIPPKSIYKQKTLGFFFFSGFGNERMTF